MDMATAIGLVVTIIGTIASIWGAIISIQGARKAKESASEATRVRDQLINQRKTSELAELRARCEYASKKMEKYGPAAKPSRQMGASITSDAEAVQNLIQSAREHQAYFEGGVVDQFASNLTPTLEQFSIATAPEDQKRLGSSIFAEIGGFHSVIRVCLDVKKDHAVAY